MQNAVYSRAAALERKIEIIAVSASDKDTLALDGSQLEKLPKLTFKDTVFVFEPNETEKRFKMINNGEAPLKIFAADVNCTDFEVILPEMAMEPFEITYLTIKRKLGNEQIETCVVTFLTNTIPNQIKKKIVVKK